MTEQKKELTAAQRAEQIRNDVKRSPFDGRSGRFPKLPERKGFYTHWVNDVNSEVDTKLSQGWEFCKRAGYKDAKVDLVEDKNQRIKIRADFKDNKEVFAFAMEIPLEIWEERRAIKTESFRRKYKMVTEGKAAIQDSTLQRAGVEVDEDSNIKIQKGN